jgi:Uma2 family endonuclease
MSLTAGLPPFEEWTADDLDGALYSGLRYEMLDGSVVISRPPTTLQQSVVLELAYLLRHRCPEHLRVHLAPLDFRPAEQRSFLPDLLVVRRGSLDGPALRVAPVLLVEVGRHDDGGADLTAKPDAYTAAGVEHYWVVDADVPRLTAFTLRDETLVETATVEGEAVLAVTAPYPVRICPARLVDGRSTSPGD